MTGALNVTKFNNTYTSIFSAWARHTNAARPTLAAVCGTHRFQVSCARLPIPAQPGATVSFRLHPERRRFQRRRLRSSSSSQLVIRCTRLSTVGDRAFPVARCRLRNSLPPDVTSASKLISFPDHFLLNCFRLLVLYTVYSSGLAVFVL